MRKASPGVICVLLGVVLLLAALGLYGYNRWEDAQAVLLDANGEVIAESAVINYPL